MSKLSVIKKISVCLAAVIVLQSFLAVKNKNLKSTISEKLAYIVSVHKGVVTTGGSVYKLLEDRHYLFNPKRTAQRPGAYFYSAADLNLGDYAKMFFKGWVHFLFEPFPWEIYTKKMLLSYPQVILWYILMPFAFLGMMLAARYNLSSFLLLFIYLFIIGSLLAMTGGNIGTVFRHRDMVMPIFIIFASAGLVFLFNINNLRITSK